MGLTKLSYCLKHKNTMPTLFCWKKRKKIILHDVLHVFFLKITPYDVGFTERVEFIGGVIL